MWGEIDMRTFVAGATKIDVIAHISREDLENLTVIFQDFRSTPRADISYIACICRHGPTGDIVEK